MNTVIIILLVVLAIAVVLLFAICGFLFNQVIWYKPIKLPAAKGEVEDDFAKDHRKAEEEFGKMPFEKLTLTASNGEKIYARLLLPEKSNGRMIIACHGAHSSGICEFCFSAPYFHRMGYTILMPEHRGCGESEGKFLGYGTHESKDTFLWIDCARKRFPELDIFLLGVSMGGAEFLAGVQSTTLKIVYMCVTYFIWEFFYTIGDIPFWGLSAAISPNPVDRSNAITSARFLSGIIGGLATPVISLLIDLSNKGVIGINMRQLFLVMGIVAGTVGMGLFSLSGIFCRERVVQNSDEPKVLDCFRFLFKNKPLLLIVCSNILATVGGVTDTFAQYFYIFSLGAASWGTIIGIPGVISGFLTYLLLPALERRWTSKQIVVRTTILKALVGTTTFLIGMKFYRNPAVIVPLLMIQGFIFSSLTSINMVVPTKMIGDTVDYMEWKTGERNEGMAFSLLTFISKLTGSLCTAIATAIIPVIGLVTVQLADNSLQLVENPQINTRFWLWALVTILPPVASLISLIPYRFYDLEGKKLKDIQEEMIARRELNSKTISKSEGEI